MATLEDVAALLEVSADQLRVLDRTPMRSAFSGEVAERVVVRDLSSGEVTSLLLDESGRPVDDGARRQRDRAASLPYESVLDADLVTLLLRHPALSPLRVRVTRRGENLDETNRVEELNVAIKTLLRLADDPAVARIELVEEPVVLDND